MHTSFLFSDSCDCTLSPTVFQMHTLPGVQGATAMPDSFCGVMTPSLTPRRRTSACWQLVTLVYLEVPVPHGYPRGSFWRRLRTAGRLAVLWLSVLVFLTALLAALYGSLSFVEVPLRPLLFFFLIFVFVVATHYHQQCASTHLANSASPISFNKGFFVESWPFHSCL